MPLDCLRGQAKTPRMRFLGRLFGPSARRRAPSSGTTNDPPARTADAPNAGVSALLRCLRDDNLSPGQDLDEAQTLLRAAGERGSDAVAALIRELLDSRSPQIGWALAAAKACSRTPALHEAVEAVVAAPELHGGRPGQGRFTPEIFGEGKIGWTTGTAMRIRRIARETLEVWDPAVSADTPASPSQQEADPGVQELVAAVKRFVDGQEHSTKVQDIGERIGPKAAPALRRLIESNGSGPMALSIVYAVGKWQPADAAPFIRHALGTGYPGAEYYGSLYLEANPTPEARQVARDCLANVRDEDSRRSLQALLQ